MRVLVIVARGLQLGYLGCYGNTWVETPAIDALAARGVVCDQHFADAADPEGARRRQGDAAGAGRRGGPGGFAAAGAARLLAAVARSGYPAAALGRAGGL